LPDSVQTEGQDDVTRRNRDELFAVGEIADPLEYCIMPRIAFDRLPPDARLWIFAAERPLSPDERRRVLDETDAFIDQWMAHGTPLTAGRDVRHNQFVLVGVDERAAGVSGCSIDALVRRMQQLETVLGVELVNNTPVLYREGDAVVRVPRDRFAELAASGTVGPNTRVFDNTLTRVGDLLAGKWEVKAADAWHARAFF
jgi:hypothetical protein